MQDFHRCRSPKDGVDQDFEVANRQRLYAVLCRKLLARLIVNDEYRDRLGLLCPRCFRKESGREAHHEGGAEKEELEKSRRWLAGVHTSKA